MAKGEASGDRTGWEGDEGAEDIPPQCVVEEDMGHRLVTGHLCHLVAHSGELTEVDLEATPHIKLQIAGCVQTHHEAYSQAPHSDLVLSLRFDQSPARSC